MWYLQFGKIYLALFGIPIFPEKCRISPRAKIVYTCVCFFLHRCLFNDWTFLDCHDRGPAHTIHEHRGHMEPSYVYLRQVRRTRSSSVKGEICFIHIHNNKVSAKLSHLLHTWKRNRWLEIEQFDVHSNFSKCCLQCDRHLGRQHAIHGYCSAYSANFDQRTSNSVRPSMSTNICNILCATSQLSNNGS